MTGRERHELPPALRRRLRRWLGAWGTPQLAATLRVEFSPRLRRAFGRCYRQDRLIRLAASLRSSQSFLLAEILCHEAAHAAVWELHGASASPHGDEWKALMRMAGFRPRLRVPVVVRAESLPGLRASSSRVLCPACHRSCGVTRAAGPARCDSCARRAARQQAARGAGATRRRAGSTKKTAATGRAGRGGIGGARSRGRASKAAKPRTLRGRAR